MWLILTTKKHIVDKNRLKPGKISVPHSLNTSPTQTICLITADPQRAAKDAIADDAFPKTLASRITRVIGFSKLKERYKSFESRRQLLSEHDVFLADERIILRLIQTLGKTFYKSSKRPIPVRIEEIQKVNGKRVKKEDKKRPASDEKYAAVAAPEVVAREIERTLNSVPVNLAPAATAAIRVGWSGFTSEQLTENIEAVVSGMTEKFVSKGWRNIKAIHLKGPNTMALPIWLAEELWLEDGDVKENDEESPKAIDASKKNDKKRKSSAPAIEAKPKKTKIADKEKDDDEDAELIAKRKAKLQSQKAKAVSDADAQAASKPTAAAGDKPSSKKKRK